MSNSSNPSLTPFLFSGKTSVLGQKWREKSGDPRAALTISQLYNLSPFIGTLLANRGFSPNTIEDFLNPTLKKLLPDPSHLKDLDKGIDRLTNAVQRGEKIAVFGDYDVDGATASALFKRYFDDIGIPLTVYIPQRLEEGYGPNIPALDLLKQQGHQLVVMVDCGTTSFDVLAHAQTIGLDVIIIDHHISTPLLPTVTALINPNRIDESSPLTTLCAAGLSFVFLIALHRRLRGESWFKDKPEPDLRQYLDLVALGTVCDVMPLTHLNRAFVAQGLKVLHHRSNIGLKALADIAGIDESLTAYHLGFLLGPRINAGGRVGKADLGSQLLSSRDPIQAQYLARELHLYNQERQTIEAEVLEQATHLILQEGLHENPVILVGQEGWHIGVIGIVAGRLKERFQKPVCVAGFEGEVGKGSGRSITGINLGSAMHAACQSGLLLKGGGHAMAAGFTVHKEQWRLFYDFLCSHFKKDIDKIDPILEIDAVLSPAALTVAFLKELRSLEPYGNANPTPRFCLHNIRLTTVERVGVNHLRAIAYGEGGIRLKTIAFRAYETELGNALLSCQGQQVALAGSVKLDQWNGREQITFVIDDLITNPSC